LKKEKNHWRGGDSPTEGEEEMSFRQRSIGRRDSSRAGSNSRERSLVLGTKKTKKGGGGGGSSGSEMWKRENLFRGSLLERK